MNPSHDFNPQAHTEPDFVQHGANLALCISIHRLTRSLTFMLLPFSGSFPISIHRLTRSLTWRSICWRWRGENFNPQAHTEPDTPDDQLFIGSKQISIHRLTRSLTNIAGDRWLRIKISIHRLTRSLTWLRRVLQSPMDISIHRLTRSLTAKCKKNVSPRAIPPKFLRPSSHRMPASKQYLT